MTLFENLQAAGLPVISADESGAISMGAMTNGQQALFNDVVMAHFQPAVYAETQAFRLDKQQLKTAYQDMITRLEQIQSAVNPTNAQIIQAIKDEALYAERIMKVLAKLI